MLREDALSAELSKQKIAFLRKLYLAHLIDSEQHNLLSLNKATSMPRRTLQDAIAAMGDIGISCTFVQDGERHNAGYYCLNDWGPIDKAWVANNIESITQSLKHD
ncbi:winged helix-turn-helix domain-containing protein [Shewanella halotolerans]|uniref:winged helix-turn-helix domain-containing protein n=1 Tax=Shewanella halotolerans TaxID=2864204 RepID=UPI001C65F589|nr:winged helix-turn-helix domain-containing protein [Shewanella halotolerans]QYJ90794.1 winged helix-turn-helix domain-containing protein [Shewanella halotolerans]